MRAKVDSGKAPRGRAKGTAWKIVLIALALAGLGLFILTPRSFWITPDRQAQRLFNQAHYASAAELFSDPARRGTALFKAAEFEAAAAAFARVNTAEGHYNRGTALVMRGKYEEAVEAFERALRLQPGWEAAANNLAIARLRAERMKREGGDMTGGEMGADEIVFDTSKKNRQGGETVETEGGKALSDQELQALWLRRVQTKPADFLRAKFAFQLAADQGTEESGADE